MTEIKLYKTTWKALRIFALTIPLVMLNIWLITKNDSSSTEKIVGWFGALFFGLGIPVGLFHLFDRRPQIIISVDGIWDRTTNQDEIKWEQIINAYPIDIYRQKFVSIIVDESFVFKTKQYKWAKNLTNLVGAQNLNIHLGQIKYDENKFAEFINEMSKTDRINRASLISIYFNN